MKNQTRKYLRNISTDIDGNNNEVYKLVCYECKRLMTRTNFNEIINNKPNLISESLHFFCSKRCKRIYKLKE